MHAVKPVNGGRNRLLGRRLEHRGFSLIELLVVIAIIALLAAVIFPVFATVKENGRQSSSIANMHDISAKLEMYRLDTNHYPPVLFGYAVPTSAPTAPTVPTSYVPMDQALSECTKDGDCQNYLIGLYPAYINNLNEFEDPNNNAPLTQTVLAGRIAQCQGDTTATADSFCSGLPGATGAGSQSSADDCACSPTTLEGQIVPVSGFLKDGSPDPNVFYAADAYDVSPAVAAGGTDITSTSNPFDYVVRYQTAWTDINEQNLDCNYSSATATAPPATAASFGLCPAEPAPGSSLMNYYLGQLRWRNPPGNTYVTSTTYHVPQAGKVLVLNQAGTVVKYDAKGFAVLEPTAVGTSYPLQISDVACAVNPATPPIPLCDVVQERFWTTTINQ